MEILGIGPGEFVLILIVLLVVVGPERLPGLARQAGGFLVRARNWLQTSPDAALIMRARAEIEAELASIKNSLMEVQVVRDEVMGAARQLGESVSSIAPPKFDINSLINPPDQPIIAANGQVIPAGETPGLVLPDGTPAIGTPLDQRSTLELPDGSSMPISPPAEAQPTNGLANGPTYSNVYSNVRPEPPVAAAPALGELESINIRLQAIMADMWALQQQLKQHGALDQSWQPPSLDVQMPAPETAPLASAEIPVELPTEPIENPAVLAARKRLEELTPMRVSHHAPPVIEDAVIDSPASEIVAAETAIVAAESSTAETSTELAPLINPLGTPAPKARKRRAAATADQSASADAPADGTPATPTHKHRTPAESVDHRDEIEPVTTEKAS